MMWIIWPLLILSSTSCIKVTETQEETDNVTTLYPTSTKHTPHNASQPTNPDSLKTGTSLTEALNKDESDSNKTESKEEPVIEKPGNDSKEFKPSEHLGNFFDEDSFGFVPLPTKSSLDAFSPLRKPPSAFIGSHKDDFKSIYKPNPTTKFPYKFEDAILTRAKSKWRPALGLDSQPTAAAPAEVPAGGLYKKPDSFKDKPSLDDDEEFGLEFSDDKEKFLKKRPNPWKSLVRLLTAFIPVGLILSALTPTLVTVQSAAPAPAPAPMLPGLPVGPEPLPPRLYRRSGAALEPPPPPPPPLPAVSEPCRRRLLCELHSDKNYHHDLRTTRRARACHRLPCEDPAALARALQWLLEHRPPNRL